MVHVLSDLLAGNCPVFFNLMEHILVINHSGMFFGQIAFSNIGHKKSDFRASSIGIPTILFYFLFNFIFLCIRPFTHGKILSVLNPAVVAKMVSEP